MAPTPNANTHLLQVRYTVAGMTHKLQFHCDAAQAGGVFYLLDPLLGPSKAWDLFVDDLADVLGPVLPTGATAAGATLYERVEGMLVPISSYTYAITAGASAAILASGVVLSFRDPQNKLMRVTVLETFPTIPSKATTIGDIGWAAMEAFATAMSDTSEGALGRYWRSRAGNLHSTFISYVADTNEKLRRLRGLK